MPLLKNKTTKDKKPDESKSNVPETQPSGSVLVTHRKVLVRPRITEKGAIVADHNAYVFDVSTGTNKKEILSEVQRLYKVRPVKVNVTQVPSKTRLVRGKWGRKSGGKKAYIYLKAGDSIQVV
jgi:large subunit ribosomal protein L23